MSAAIVVLQRGMRRLFRISGVLAVLVGLLTGSVRDAHTQPNGGPVSIMLIRHAEDVGVSGEDLSPRGYERAEALPRLFSSRLPRPDVIIATRASKESNRPIETMEPLSRQLHVPIDDRFRDKDYQALAHALLTDARYAGKVVLVCWHHGKIPNLAKAIGVTAAPRWPDSQFDRVWVIDPRRAPATYSEVHQRLLDGDQ